MSMVWRDSGHDMISIGNSDRKVTEVILYDESGPLITDYTNLNDYEYHTERPISIRAIKKPDYTNPNGFLIREYSSYHARYESGAWFVLFIHIDNVPAYAKELLGYWQMYNLEPGAIQCEFSLEGCHFNRIVANPEIETARKAVSEALEKYNGWMGGGFFHNSATILGETERALKVYEGMARVVREYERVRDHVSEDYGIVELIHENGADKPIGPYDFNSLRQYAFMEVSDD